MTKEEMLAYRVARRRGRFPVSPRTQADAVLTGGHVPDARRSVWISGFNVPGCLPDADAAPVAVSWAEAWDGLLDEIQRERDVVAGDAELDAELLHAYALVVATPPGQPVDVTTRGSRGYVAWWIMRTVAIQASGGPF